MSLVTSSNVPFSAGYSASVSSTLRVADPQSTDCDFQFIFNNMPQQQTFNRVTVVDFVVPKSWYQVNTGRNTFTLVEGIMNIIVTVPPGNYFRSTWLTILGNLLTAASASVGHNYTYTVTGPNTSLTAETYVNTITVTNNAGVQPQIIIPANTTINEILGLGEDSKNPTTYTFSNNVLVPPYIASFQLEWSVYLHSDIVAGDGDDVLCAIFNTSTGGDGQSVRYQAQHPTLAAKRYIPKPGLGYRFWLTDELTNLMDTHGLNVNFTLLFFRVEDPAKSLESKIDKLANSVTKLLEIFQKVIEHKDVQKGAGQNPTDEDEDSEEYETGDNVADSAIGHSEQNSILREPIEVKEHKL